MSFSATPWGRIGSPVAAVAAALRTALLLVPRMVFIAERQHFLDVETPHSLSPLVEGDAPKIRFVDTTSTRTSGFYKFLTMFHLCYISRYICVSLTDGQTVDL